MSAVHSMLRISPTPRSLDGILVDPTAPQYLDFGTEACELHKYWHEKVIKEEGREYEAFGSSFRYLEDRLRTSNASRSDRFMDLITSIASMTISKEVSRIMAEFGGAERVWDLEDHQFSVFSESAEQKLYETIKDFHDKIDHILFEYDKEDENITIFIDDIPRLEEWEENLIEDEHSIEINRSYRMVIEQQGHNFSWGRGPLLE